MHRDGSYPTADPRDTTPVIPADDLRARVDWEEVRRAAGVTDVATVQTWGTTCSCG